MLTHLLFQGQDRDGNPVYWLTCQYVDYDGTRFGTNKLNVCIPVYQSLYFTSEACIDI